MDREKLLYSFNGPVPGSDRERYDSFRSRLFLAAGSEDKNSPAADIYDNARTRGQGGNRPIRLAQPCAVEDTGHSIEDERRM
jgi:hypothetical protein